MSQLPLAGVKICDFMWVMAGPAATRILADFGATVVRVESHTRADPARAVGPHLRDCPSPDSSMLWNNNNAGKFGLGLDLSASGAAGVVHDLVRWADVICESFAPGTMARLGFGFETMRAINAKLVMVSTSLLGQHGPHAGLAGFGNLSAAVTGFYGLCGWPDRPPAGPFGAYTDYIAPRYIAAVILAALARRDRTGDGEYVDLAQSEAALHFIAPALLDEVVNGKTAVPSGNVDPLYAPHGAYPCREEDTWVAVACRTDDQWRSLCEAMGKSLLAADAQFSEASVRKENKELLDALIGEWTTTLQPDQVETILQGLGVPSSVVQNSSECFADRQLHHRGHFTAVEHSLIGTITIEGPRIRLSRTPGAVVRAAPRIGEHSRLVLTEFLGYGGEQVDELVAAKTILS
jgi:benzylsuccinate CoA-transferase BbsF subunit